MSKIKRGVSLYSFQEEMFLGQMSVEDCVSFAASIGATGIEVLPEQNMPSFPHFWGYRVSHVIQPLPQQAFR